MKSNGIYRALTIVVQASFGVIVPLLIMILLGTWIDKRLGTHHLFLVIFTIVGIIVGLKHIIELAKRI